MLVTEVIWRSLFLLLLSRSCFCESSFPESELGEPDIAPENFLRASSKEQHDTGKNLCVRNEQGKTVYAGAEGALTDGDCAALFYFTTMQIYVAAKMGRQEFRYIETGSYGGLSTTVVATAILLLKVPAMIYSHDLFDEAPPYGNSLDAEKLWATHSGNNDNTRLQMFYSNILRNNLHHLVVPIAGPSHRTLRIHPAESADLIFVDGDHSYNGALGDLRLAWQILIPGGYILVHDCFPPGSHLETVRQAVKDFTLEVNITWTLFWETMYMAVLHKPVTPTSTEMDAAAALNTQGDRDVARDA